MSSDAADALPHPHLIGLVGSYNGSVLSGFPAGVHLGTPGLVIPLILTLQDRPVRYANRSGEDSRSFSSLIAGLHQAPALITHDGSAASLTIHLTLAGARCLLGVPARDLLGTAVSATDILGPSVERLRQRVEQLQGWSQRFGEVDSYLLHRIRDRDPQDSLAYEAWRLIESGQGRVRVSTVASELGCSQRTLHSVLQREAGIGPKLLSRIARFNSARTLIHHRLASRQRTPTLADVAADCGYHDESHLIHEWSAFTGTTPTNWRTRDELAFHQTASTE